MVVELGNKAFFVVVCEDADGFFGKGFYTPEAGLLTSEAEALMAAQVCEKDVSNILRVAVGIPTLDVSETLAKRWLDEIVAADSGFDLRDDTLPAFVSRNVPDAYIEELIAERANWQTAE